MKELIGDEKQQEVQKERGIQIGKRCGCRERVWRPDGSVSEPPLAAESLGQNWPDFASAFPYDTY